MVVSFLARYSTAYCAPNKAALEQNKPIFSAVDKLLRGEGGLNMETTKDVAVFCIVLNGAMTNDKARMTKE